MKKVIKENYNLVLSKVSSILEEARKKTIRQIDTVIIETYWKIGEIIVKEEQKGKEKAKYGDYLIKRLSDDLTKKFGKGFNVANIWNFRQFYLTYPKLYALRRELSWTHYRILMRIEEKDAKIFYELETIKNNWSSRELQRQINSLLFERLVLSRNKNKVLELSQKGHIIEKPEDAIKNPYILEFLGLPEKSYYTESQLEQKLIDHLQEFILELGKGFTFVGRQKRITIDNEHYYIDLIFYHRILKCLVLIDLKIGVLSHGDVGQMNFYLNYIKDKEMIEGENPPIGIILCTERNKSKVFVEYALGSLKNKIFVSKYKLYLPTKQQLESEVKKEMSILKLT